MRNDWCIIEIITLEKPKNKQIISFNEFLKNI